MIDFQYRVRFLGLVLGLILTLATSTFGASKPGDADDKNEWSEVVNGLQGRLQLERWKVSNGSCVVASYLELKNQSATLTLTKTPKNMKFRVTDKDGNEVEVEKSVTFSGWLGGTPQLVLPGASSMRIRIGPTGHGIGSDLAAHLDLGVDHYWALPEGEFYLSAVLEVERTARGADDAGKPWHGRIEFPPVLIPTNPNKIDPEKLGPLIDELGSTIVSQKGHVAEEAANQLSLIDDPRVIPWYVQVLKGTSYHFKCLALDQLGFFETDEAFEALKLGMATKPEDFGDTTTTREVAESLVDNVRIYASDSLIRSCHPDAKAFFLKFHDDASSSIRLRAIQFAARLETDESLLLIRSHLDDEDETVRNEAKYLLDGLESKQ